MALPAVAACAATASSSLYLLFRVRFFSLSRSLDKPQPRKTNCEDHHDDKNGVLGHRIGPELLHQYLFTEGGLRFPISIYPLIHINEVCL
jgi:hypothetical protein